MASLPGELWLMQQIDGEVVLFHRHTELVIVRFDPSDQNAVAMAQKVIHDTELLDAEGKSFAHFWSGYFYAYSNMDGLSEDG